MMTTRDQAPIEQELEAVLNFLGQLGPGAGPAEQGPLGRPPSLYERSGPSFQNPLPPDAPINGEIAGLLSGLGSLAEGNGSGGPTAPPVSLSGAGNQGPIGRSPDLYEHTGPSFRNPFPPDAPISQEIGSLAGLFGGGSEPSREIAPRPNRAVAPQPNDVASALSQLKGEVSGTESPTMPLPTGAEQMGNATVYTIQPGDSLSLIGAMFGVTYDELIAANPDILGEKGKSTVIHPDQKLVIPQKAQKAAV